MLAVRSLPRDPFSFVNQGLQSAPATVQHRGLSACAYCHAIEGPGESFGIPPFHARSGALLRHDPDAGLHETRNGSGVQRLHQDGVGSIAGGLPRVQRTRTAWRISDHVRRSGKRSKYAKAGGHLPGLPHAGRAPARQLVPGPGAPEGGGPLVQPRACPKKARPGKARGPSRSAPRRSDPATRFRVFALVPRTQAGDTRSRPENDQKVVLIRIRVLTQAGKHRLGERPLHRVEHVDLRRHPWPTSWGAWPADTWTAASVPRRQKDQGRPGKRDSCAYDAPLGDQKGPYKGRGAAPLSAGARPEHDRDVQPSDGRLRGSSDCSPRRRYRFPRPWFAEDLLRGPETRGPSPPAAIRDVRPEDRARRASWARVPQKRGPRPLGRRDGP